MWENREKFYHSKEWINFRIDVILARGNICEMCGKHMFAEDRAQVHHTPIELTDQNVNDVTISLNPDNVKYVCLKCHNSAHGRYSGGGTWKRRQHNVYLVYGPPMSGKTTYVKERMSPGDLVVDMDALYKAISFQNEYDKPDNLKTNVLGVRSFLLNEIKTRHGSFNDAWIIGGYPNSVRREQIANSVGAELIYLETPKQECIRRLERCIDSRRDHVKEWKQYIDEWFEMYSP